MTAARRPDMPDHPSRQERLSSVVDGECPADLADQACRDWRSDDELRGSWHVYHLIGDVLRSDELSSPAAHDAAFLQALRGRLAAEPVPLAPASVSSRLRVLRSRRWMGSAAVAAGFMVVGAAVVVLGPDSATDNVQAMQVLSVQSNPAGPLQRVGSVAAPASSQTLLIDGQVIRDARLDAYFEAHRGATGAMPSAVPGGALRSVEILVPQR